MIKLDLVPSCIKPVLHASQYDEGRQWPCQVLNDGVPFVFQNGDTVDYTIRKGDGLLVTGAVAVTPGTSTITLVSTEQMCAVYGSNLGELTITSNGAKVGSVNFILEVERAPDEGGLQSESEIKNLNAQIDDHVDEVLPEQIAEEVPPIVERVVGENYYNKSQSDAFITDEYDAESTYAVGDMVIHENALYVCSTAITTAEAWDSAHWTLTDIATAIGTVKTAIPTKTSQLQNDSGFAQIDDSEESTSKTWSSEKIDEVVGGVQSEVVAVKNATVEVHKSLNILDINTLERGNIQWNGTFNPNPTGDNWVTPYFEVKKGDYIHYTYLNAEREMRFVSLYKADKTFIGNYSNQTLYNVTNEDAKYCRLTLYKPILRIKTMVAVTQSSEMPDFDWHYEPYTIVKGERPRLDIYSADGITNFWEKMQEAYYKQNCDVYVHTGEYVFTNELVDKIRELNRRGVPIGNNCHYYFDTGANITCEYTGDNTTDVKGYFTPLDSWNFGTDFEIYNLTLVSKNTVYALHDEADGETTPIKHLYKNCYISYDSSALGLDSNALSKCIGGGLALHSEITIEDCVFDTVNPNSEAGEDVSYHKANNQSYTDCKFVLTGCYFSGKFRCDFDYSPIPTITSKIIACGNSATAINAYQWDKKLWNNEIRT